MRPTNPGNISVPDWEGSTYREVYTGRFECAIHVLRSFQKSAQRGMATPKSDLDSIEPGREVAERTFKETESCVPYTGSSSQFW